jgi:chloramphenicol 3-O-phosphotransferase
MAEILILTGPHGVGKSAVALALADRYDRVAHVQVDVLRHFVTPTGYVAPGKPGFERQHGLAVRNACDIARNFFAERFAVIIEDVVPDRPSLAVYVEALQPSGAAIHFVRLMAPLDVCQARNRERRAERQTAERVESVWRLFDAAKEIPGVSIDTSELPVYAVADRLQELTTAGESIVWRPDGASAGP